MSNNTGNTQAPIHLLIVDDEELIRAGLSVLVQDMEGIAAATTACSGAEALELVSKPKFRDITVALVDARMPGMSGPELIGKLRDSHPRIKCILLTAFDEDDNLVGALKAGAVGYLLKDVSASDMQRAIEAAAHGRLVLGESAVPHAMRFIAAQGSDTGISGCTSDKPALPLEAVQSSADRHGTRALPSKPTISEDTKALLDLLTDRERQIAQLVAQGRTNSEIASAVFLSSGTVKNHISHIFGVLGVRNRTELTALLNGTLN